MSAEAEMPRYKCHKEVWALKIAKIDYHGNFNSEGAGGLGATIIPDDPRYAAFEVDNRYVMKHAPKVGGYYVVYDDGYKSFSPAKAFEDGYTKIA